MSATTICRHCGTDFTQPDGRGRPAYCSEDCRRGSARIRNAAGSRRRWQESKSRRSPTTCGNPFCQTIFSIDHRRMYCSIECCQVVHAGRTWGQRGMVAAAIRFDMVKASLVWFCACPDCGSPVVQRARNGTATVCPPCRKMRNKAINARKNQARRTAGPKVLSVSEIAARDGSRCNLCGKRVDLTLSGMAKWGPTIDHLIPVSHGGTNDADNLALAHRHCNVSRKNRGHAQLLLTA